jgi:RimJ/RimL family protein N-acetyltransferase
MNGDPEVMRYIGAPMSTQEVAGALPAWTEGHGDFGLWAGRLEDGGFAGVWFLSADPDDARAGELGWRLPQDRWRQGYAVEAAGALADHAFGGARPYPPVGGDDGGQHRLTSGHGAARDDPRAQLRR